MRLSHAVFSLAKARVVLCGIAYLAAAAHNEPRRQFVTVKLRLIYPLFDKARDAPAVGRRDKHEPFRPDRGGVPPVRIRQR